MAAAKAGTGTRAKLGKKSAAAPRMKKCGPRESAAEKTARARRIVAALRGRYPRATTALHYGAPHELLISTVLAAQCTDKKVNEITETLFKKYRSVEDFAKARRPTLEKEIRQSGFFRAKAKSISGARPGTSWRDSGAEVPGTMEELTSLRGVGRKTANVVLSAVFGKPGVIVDTHMMRVAARLGLTDRDRSHQDRVRAHGDPAKEELGGLLLHGGASRPRNVQGQAAAVRHLPDREDVPLEHPQVRGLTCPRARTASPAASASADSVQHRPGHAQDAHDRVVRVALAARCRRRRRCRLVRRPPWPSPGHAAARSICAGGPSAA